MDRADRAGFCLVLIAFALAGCGHKTVLENETALFKQYKSLEDTMTNVMSFSSPGFKKEYDKFLKDSAWTGNSSGLADGVYESLSVIDMRDYLHYVRFEVKGGRIVDVHYDEFKPGDAKGKRDDAAYNALMSRTTGITAAEAYPVFEKQLLSVQDPLMVDTVSGATLSTYRFKLNILKAIHESRTKRVLNKKTYEKELELFKKDEG
jgi:major membrane immunogen (membrane-anchored lipoprotein)